MGSKRVKLEDEKEDRISDLPDPIIQHIISFLPSTKEAIQTGILSKQWKYQWKQVPVLIFNNSTTFGMSDENFFKIIHNTLIQHDCSKINKFHLYLSGYYYEPNQSSDPEITSIISFTTSKGVEDLNLSLLKSGFYFLPEFIFNHASLVKLRTQFSSFVLPNGKVNWGSLTTLSILHCKLTDQAIEQIVSGSPVLESLELASCSGFDKIVIASKYLKRLVLRHNPSYISVIEISCPNLVEFSLDGISTSDPNLVARAIGSVLYRSLILESLSIQSINCRTIVIASRSLKRLAIGSITNAFYIKISCPKLERLKLLENLNVNAAKLLKFSSSLCATIDFHRDWDLRTHKSVVKDILPQLQRVKELKLGSWFISILSTISVGCRFSPRLRIKCLTLDTPYLIKHHTAIACLLRISPVLEKLVILWKHSLRLTTSVQLPDIGMHAWFGDAADTRYAVFVPLIGVQGFLLGHKQ